MWTRIVPTFRYTDDVPEIVYIQTDAVTARTWLAVTSYSLDGHYINHEHCEYHEMLHKPIDDALKIEYWYTNYEEYDKAKHEYAKSCFIRDPYSDEGDDCELEPELATQRFNIATCRCCDGPHTILTPLLWRQDMYIAEQDIISYDWFHVICEHDRHNSW